MQRNIVQNMAIRGQKELVVQKTYRPKRASYLHRATPQGRIWEKIVSETKGGTNNQNIFPYEDTSLLVCTHPVFGRRDQLPSKLVYKGG